jgi:hypothetical protein
MTRTITTNELEATMNEDLAALAADAYIYGYPLVTNLREVRRFTRDGLGSLPPAPFNSFGHATRLAGPAEKFASVNNDTVYSVAQVDLSGGPLVLTVPATAGRYYVLQFVDAWTNNFAYAGRRATGTGAGSFLLTPPHWKGGAPAEMGDERHRVPGRRGVDRRPLGLPGAGRPARRPGAPRGADPETAWRRGRAARYPRSRPRSA